jgi:hypothetical protein
LFFGILVAVLVLAVATAIWYYHRRRARAGQSLLASQKPSGRMGAQKRQNSQAIWKQYNLSDGASPGGPSSQHVSPAVAAALASRSGKTPSKYRSEAPSARLLGQSAKTYPTNSEAKSKRRAALEAEERKNTQNLQHQLFTSQI